MSVYSTKIISILSILEGHASNSYTTILISLKTELKNTNRSSETVKPIYPSFSVFSFSPMTDKNTIDNSHGLKCIKHEINQQLCGLQFTFRKVKSQFTLNFILLCTTINIILVISTMEHHAANSL